MKNNKKIISISIDKSINDDMENAKANKSKLINHLLKEHLLKNKGKKNFNKK